MKKALLIVMLLSVPAVSVAKKATRSAETDRGAFCSAVIDQLLEKICDIQSKVSTPDGGGGGECDCCTILKDLTDEEGATVQNRLQRPYDALKSALSNAPYTTLTLTERNNLLSTVASRLDTVINLINTLPCDFAPIVQSPFEEEEEEE